MALGGFKMMNFLDMYERALKGPVMSEKDFELKVFIPRIRDVVKKYGIRYDREHPLPVDDGAADILFEAAVDFMCQTGVYCMDTNRLMQFTREEILRAIKEGPRVCHVGEGKDAGVIGTRKPDDPKIPWLQVGSGIIFSAEEYMTNLVEGYASIAEVNSINIPALGSIRGIRATVGTPAEFYATVRGLRIALEALRRAGRPGLPILNLHPTSASAVTTIAASAPQFGCRRTDGWMGSWQPEMKVNHEMLNIIAYLRAWGAIVIEETGPMLGGYAGGPEGFAVLCTAYLLAGQLVHRTDCHLNFPIHFKHVCSTTRDVLWGVSISIQAASRNIPIPCLWDPYCAAGPNTKMYFYETAAVLLAWVTSGAPGITQPHPAKAAKVDGITPMEAKFAVEMAMAATRFTRAKAHDLVIRLLEKYESQIETAPEGSRYPECYDPATGKPSEAYIRLYEEVKEELARMGIDFS